MIMSGWKDAERARLMRMLEMVCRVMVADDDLDFRGWLRSLLDHSGDFQLIAEAGNGAEALQIIRALLPDLVIADMYMPEPDGIEIVRYVQRHFSGIKAILVSAHEERVYERLAREEGALAFISKARLSLEALRQAWKGEAVR